MGTNRPRYPYSGLTCLAFLRFLPNRDRGFNSLGHQTRSREEGEPYHPSVVETMEGRGFSSISGFEVPSPPIIPPEIGAKSPWKRPGNSHYYSDKHSCDSSRPWFKLRDF